MTVTGRLEIGTLRVAEVDAVTGPVDPGGRCGRFRDGSLELDLRAIESAVADPVLDRVHAVLVRAGESVRVVDVLDAVEPAVKIDAPEATFPGVLGLRVPAGRPGAAGRGRTRHLAGLSVVTAMDLGRWFAEDPPPASIIDFGGPGRDLTPWVGSHCVVLELSASDGASLAEADLAARRAALIAARELASIDGDGGEPDRIEVLDPGPAPDHLPGVCVVLQVTAEGPGLSTYLWGEPVDRHAPCVVDPLAVLDGALTSGAYDSPAARNPTASYQRSALIRRLVAEHGRTLRLVGSVLALGYLDAAEDKRRMAAAAADLAVGLGAEGAVLTTYSLGNSHTDTMLTVRACEERGVRAVAILAEEAGLTDHVPEADALVSVGNVLEHVEPWRPDRVLGGPTERVSTGPLPLLHYMGAATQLGELGLRGVSA